MGRWAEDALHTVVANIFPRHVDQEGTKVLLLQGVGLAGKEINHRTAQEDFQTKTKIVAHRRNL